MLLIIKNMRVTHTENEYLLINTENSNMYRKTMTPSHAKAFVDKLDAIATAPIELMGKNYKEVSFDDFDFPLPF